MFHTATIVSGDMIFLTSISPTASAKHKEIFNSEVRSQAARFAHQRARRTRLAAHTNAKTTKLLEPANPGVNRSRPTFSRKADAEVRSRPREDKQLAREPHNASHGSPYIRPKQCLLGDIEKISIIYWNISALCTAQFCSILKTRNVLNSEWLQHMSDEAFFHVGAALVKGEYRELLSLGGRMDQEVFFHKTKALEVIKTRLAQAHGQLDNVTLLAILFLPFTDDLIADRRACAIHWNAAAKVLAARGRLQAIKSSEHGAYTLDVINQVRGFCLVHIGIDLLSEIPTSVISSSIPSKPVYYTSDTTSSPSEFLPSGLKALNQCGLIGEHTFRFAHHIIDVLQFGGQPKSLNLASSECIDQQASTSNFQEAWGFFNLKPTSTKGEPSIEKVVSIAMIVYSTRTIGPIRMASFVSRSARASLSIAVQRCIIKRSQEEEDALFWASTVAVESWKNRLSEVMGDGIAIRNFQRWRFPDHLSPDISRLTLEKFFYDEELLEFQERYTKDFWN